MGAVSSLTSLARYVTDSPYEGGFVCEMFFTLFWQAVAVKTLDKKKMKQLKALLGPPPETGQVPDRLVHSEVEFMRPSPMMLGGVWCQIACRRGECKGQPWFVQLHDFLETASSFHLLLEYCDGGNLEVMRPFKSGRTARTPQGPWRASPK